MGAASEWLRDPAPALAIVAGVLLVLAGGLVRRIGPGLAALATAVALAAGQWSLYRIEHSWRGPQGERERRIQRASRLLNDELTRARLAADSLARAGLDLAPPLSREHSFEAAGSLVRRNPVESGLILFEESGLARTWAGRFRLRPEPRGDSVAVHLTPYYAVLEVRRHDAAGRISLGTILLAAHELVPDGDRSVAARFRQRTEVGLEILDPADAPDISDVFDYELPTTAGPQVLFSVQFVPPEQDAAVERARQSAAARVTWLLLATIVAALWVVPAGLWRTLVMLLPLTLVFRSPLGQSLGIPEWFDPGVFSSPTLGPVSSSAAALALTGIGLMLLSRAFPRRRWPRAVAVPLAAGLLVVTPFLLAGLGRGILPPLEGVSPRLFLIWDLGLFLFGAGLISVALALVRPAAGAGTGAPAAAVTVLLSSGAAVLGFLLWHPLTDWPDWYFAVWVLAAIPLLLPLARAAELVGVAVLSGSLAVVLAWGADNQGKVRAARADIAGLTGPAFSPVATRVGELITAVRAVPVPGSVTDLYRIWRNSPLYPAGTPAALGVWRPDGSRLFELRLDEIDLPGPVVREAILTMTPADSLLVRVLDREPAPHHLVVVRRGDLLVSIAAGPPTGLVPPSRTGRLLGARAPGRPLYRLSLGPMPTSPGNGEMTWRREGARVLGHYTLRIGTGARDLFGTVEIGTAQSLVVRGSLVVLLNLAVLTLLGGLAGVLVGEQPSRPVWIPRFRSYQARVGIALAVFFLAPTIGFAAWGLGRLRGEVRASRDRVIEQTLRDVVPERLVLPPDSSALSHELIGLSERTDADFLVYLEGVLEGGTGGGLLQALGIVSPVMDPDAFHRLVIDGAAVTTGPGPSREVDVRIGYRVMRMAGPGAGVLAMPQTGIDPVLEDRQRDLALLFLLLTILGVGASLLAARFAARALARPVAELQSAALAFGKGREVTLPVEPPAPEFAPVYAAFEKMTGDVRRAQEAQERVARIVAWGEMASQVAHEIKNPLTPMRLGVQHLRRVHEDGHTPIGPVLESTTGRILAEIDRLDRIARSFSRFGIPQSERGPLEAVKLPSVVRDVAELYRLGPEGAEITVEVERAEPAAGRADEIKEALVNLLENSRNARARTIRVRIRGTTLEVSDDGKGIPAELLPRIFEPRFSTSTSGSGLGLAIVKRLVESWGGALSVESTEGFGTVVRLELRPAGAGGPGPANVTSTPPTEPVQ